ncbi:uncharacterized protein METZ01_LOCUS373596, partial [marine metagenome]
MTAFTPDTTRIEYRSEAPAQKAESIGVLASL